MRRSLLYSSVQPRNLSGQVQSLPWSYLQFTACLKSPPLEEA